MDALFFVNHSTSHKKNKLLKVGLDEIDKILMFCNTDLKVKLLESYLQIFKYIDFDTFAKIKELYSNKTYDFLPSWETYFQLHNITPIHKPKNKDPIRLIFKNSKSGISIRDEHLIVYDAEKIDWSNPINQSLIRRPFFLNLEDIDYAGYFKLLKYLILKYYLASELYNASKLSKFGQRSAIETNRAYVMFENRRVKSIGDCIKHEDDSGLKYLVEELGIKPTLGQLKIIEQIFHEDIYDLVSYYFE
jgi:hypothetical protein